MLTETFPLVRSQVMVLASAGVAEIAPAGEGIAVPPPAGYDAYMAVVCLTPKQE